MADLREMIEYWVAPEYDRTVRGEGTYRATEAYLTQNLNRLVELYHYTPKTDLQTRRLVRDDIDNALRRYHGYCIRGSIGAHYVQDGIDPKKPKTYVFEHLVPNSTVRDMFIAGIITAREACNMPTCLLSRENDVILKQQGWNSRTPDAYEFWKRYDLCFPDTTFSTWDGNPVDKNTNLEDHFERFGI